MAKQEFYKLDYRTKRLRIVLLRWRRGPLRYVYTPLVFIPQSNIWGLKGGESDD